MKYYFIFNSQTNILDNIQTTEPQGLTDKYFKEWDTDVYPRTKTIVDPDGVEEDDVIDFFKNAIPGFAKDIGTDLGTTSFSYHGLEDEEAVQEAKDNQLELVRLGRNDKLAKSDWTQLTDSPLTDEDKALWQTYRQGLRDITEDLTNPFIVSWPTEPS